MNAMIVGQQRNGGIEMTKQLVEYREKEEGFEVEVFGFCISAAEHKEAFEDLENLGFRFSNIHADSLRATFSGDYDTVMMTLNKLSEKGWKWNDED